MYIKYKTDTLEIVAVSPKMPWESEGCDIVEKPEITTTDVGYIKIYRSPEGVVIEEISNEEKQQVLQQRLERAKQLKKREIANARYECEISGITYNNAEIATDRISQSKIAGAIQYFDLNPNVISIPWKAKNGWFNFTKDDMVAIATAVANHIEECFMKEKELFEQIDNAQTMEDLAKIQWSNSV